MKNLWVGWGGVVQTTPGPITPGAIIITNKPGVLLLLSTVEVEETMTLPGVIGVVSTGVSTKVFRGMITPGETIRTTGVGDTNPMEIEGIMPWRPQVKLCSPMGNPIPRHNVYKA